MSPRENYKTFRCSPFIHSESNDARSSESSVLRWVSICLGPRTKTSFPTPVFSGCSSLPSFKHRPFRTDVVVSYHLQVRRHRRVGVKGSGAVPPVGICGPNMCPYRRQARGSDWFGKRTGHWGGKGCALVSDVSVSVLSQANPAACFGSPR